MSVLSALICMIISVIIVLVSVLVEDHAAGCARSWEHIGRYAGEAA